MLKKILVPIDGSTGSWNALDYARVLGKQFNSRITVVHVVQSYYTLVNTSISGDAPFIPLNLEVIEKTGRTLLKLAEEKMTDFGGSFTTRLEFGDPAQRIIAVAEEEGCDAIVIGSRGLSGFEELFLGSVSTKVAQYAKCSVLIAK